LIYLNSINTFFYLFLFLLPWSAIAITETPNQFEIEKFIRQVAIENNIPPSWAVGIVQKESQFNINAVGDSGRAFGLWQIWKPTWDIFTKKYLNETDQVFADYKNWRWQTIVAIRALADNKWTFWRNSVLAKEKEIKDYEPFTLGSCMAYLWNEKGIKIKGDAKDIKVNTTTPATGFVVKIKYNAFHAAFVEQVSKDGIFVSETNFIPNQFSQRFIPFTDKRILGYYAP